MSAKKVVAWIIVLTVIALVGYFLMMSAANGGGRGGNGGGILGSDNARTIVTLTIMGGSAFITGFGFRDVIGRAVTARQRARVKSAQQPVRH